MLQSNIDRFYQVIAAWQKGSDQFPGWTEYGSICFSFDTSGVDLDLSLPLVTPTGRTTTAEYSITLGDRTIQNLSIETMVDFLNQGLRGKIEEAALEL